MWSFKHIFLVISAYCALTIGQKSEISRCCTKNFSDRELHNCLDSALVQGGNSTAAIITLAFPGTGDFSIPDIESFSVFQRAIVAAYAEFHHYSHRFIHSINGVDFEGTTDSRWFKVKLLLDAISANGWAAEAKYLLWLDADAIVLDYSLDVEAIGSIYPNAQLVASADIRMGLINTGVLLLRNSQWTRQFLEHWWYGLPGESGRSSLKQQNWRREQCDQEAFDRVFAHYAALQRQEQGVEAAGRHAAVNEIQVLPMDALNSHPPAALHQTPRSPVLHLMGESSAVRRRAFQQAWQQGVCAAAQVPAQERPAQLSLNRTSLQLIAREVYGGSISELLAEAAAPVARPLLDVDQLDGTESTWDAEETRLDSLLLKPLEALSVAAHHYCDLLRHLAQQQAAESEALALLREEQDLRRRIQSLVHNRIEQFRAAAAEQVASLRADPSLAGRAGRAQRLLVGCLAQLLKRAAEAGNDVFGAVVAPGDKDAAAELVFRTLEELLAVVDRTSRHVPLHMQALMHQNLGAMEHSLAAAPDTRPPASRAHLEAAARHLRASVSTFDERRRALDAADVAEDSSTLMEESYSLQLLAGTMCELGQFGEGTALWTRAVGHARRALLGIELGVRYSNLAVVLYNAAQCHAEASRRAEAVGMAREAADVASRTAAQGADEAQHSALLAAIEALLLKLGGGAGPVGIVHKLSGSTDTYRVVSGGQAGEGKGEGEDEGDWVECELHEKCDVFEVAGTAPEAASEISSPEINVLEGVDVEGMSAEEVEELREVRERYFRQTIDKTAGTTLGRSHSAHIPESASRSDSRSTGSAEALLQAAAASLGQAQDLLDAAVAVSREESPLPFQQILGAVRLQNDAIHVILEAVKRKG